MRQSAITSECAVIHSLCQLWCELKWDKINRNARRGGPLKNFTPLSVTFATAVFLSSCARAPQYDVVLRNGRVCDGSGAPCVAGGVAIRGDTIAKVGDLGDARGKTERDVHGQVIAPGFINLMSSESGLFADGRSQSDIRQGVTLEIFGEGESMGPVNDQMRAEQEHDQSDIKYPITWRTLAEGLDTLAGRGISPNIAS